MNVSTKCVLCGQPTLIRGWDWCEDCATRQSKNQLGIAVIADAIVQLDQRGVPRADRVVLWRQFGIDPKRVEAAEAHVTERYAAANIKRGRSSRGW